MAKISRLAGDAWVPLVHPLVLWSEETRLVAAVSCNQIDVVLRCAELMTEPLALLWVLHAPRSGVQAGRYQSMELFFEEVRSLLQSRRPLFEEDGRSDVWVHSRDRNATIVLDRHDLIYFYGFDSALVTRLRALGFDEGHVEIPSPHAHEYYEELDELERGFSVAVEWKVTELRPEDG